jgi:hypothetical protein
MIISNLIFPRHLLELDQGKDGTFLANVLIADIAPAAHADPALHTHLKGKYNPLRLKPLSKHYSPLQVLTLMFLYRNKPHGVLRQHDIAAKLPC